MNGKAKFRIFATLSLIAAMVALVIAAYAFLVTKAWTSLIGVAIGASFVLGGFAERERAQKWSRYAIFSVIFGLLLLTASTALLYFAGQ